MNALRYEDARRRIEDGIVAVSGDESVRLADALGRTLAADLVSPVDVPAHDSSAMDGYALRAPPANAPKPLRLRVVGGARAGHPHRGPVGAGECVRIMTGAVMPDGCDTVVPWEHVEVAGDEIAVDALVSRGRHRRPAGENLATGALVLSRGRRLTASDLGLAASIGIARLTVVRRPRIAVFSTGNELRELDEPLAVGSVRDTNRYALIGLLTALRFEIVDLGIVRDDPDALEAAITRACVDASADAIVTSGGVSAGDADYTRATMERLGEVSFWKLAIKPGRPMAFGHVTVAGHRALFFGLPGNPVAVMVSFHALVRRALLKLAGGAVTALPSLVVVCDAPIAKVAGRTEFVRGIAFATADGWHVRTTGDQGSGILRSMSDANCLIVLGHDRGPVDAGDVVEAWPFEGLG